LRRRGGNKTRARKQQQNACPPRMLARCKVHRKKLPVSFLGVYTLY
jgi:hypothetical protein